MEGKKQERGLGERVGGRADDCDCSYSGYFTHCLTLACTQPGSQRPHTIHDTHTRNMTACPRFDITDGKLKTERQHERGEEVGEE